MKILLLSAYDADSHRYWHTELRNQLPEHQWTALTLPGRYFSWRIRGNSLSWAFNERETLSKNYDLLIATSMTDLSALIGLCPSLASIPSLVYFHENQFAYPFSGKEFKSVEPKILNLYTALAADKILFNSQWNLDSLLSGIDQLARKLPDHVPDNLRETIQERSEVLQVPLNATTTKPQQQNTRTKGCIRIAWAARWEFDKGPDRLLAIIKNLEDRGFDFRLRILGQKFRNSPVEFSEIEQQYAHRIDQFGYAESRQDYLQWLATSDIILSTATHEFQGLSVLEAINCGCIPVVPNRVAYPELLPENYLYQSDENPEIEAKHATNKIVEFASLLDADTSTSPPSVSKYLWNNLLNDYARAIETTAAIRKS